MASYKKSFLSAAAAIAISASVVSADYLPLANAALDDKWMLFGASGFLTDGGVDAGVQGVFTISNVTAPNINMIEDAYDGDIVFETSGLFVDNSITSGDLATLKALNTASHNVQIRVDTTGATFNETEPTRTIYVDIDDDGVGDFAFTYKAQLEGKRLEYSVNGGNAHFITINYANTYDNPVAGTLITGSEAVQGDLLSDLVDLGKGTLIDYDFRNNPINYLNFDAATHADAAENNESLRLYSYDANNGGLWTLFDDRYANSANDFLSLDKGRGYWGKMALDVNRTAGLVLGSSTVSAADYQALNLTEGWNLLAFNKANNTELRHANTGLIVTIDTSAAVGGGNIVFKDSSRNQSVTVSVDENATMAALAQNINFEMMKAKAQGTLPKVFNLKAFPTAADKLALISNKKFSIHDDTNATKDIITGATTLSADPTLSMINPTTEALLAQNANVASAGASSIYGEYAMVIQPLTGAGTASGLGGAKLNIKSQLETVAGGTDNDVTIDGNLTTAVSALTIPANDLRAYEFDIDQDGTTDHALLASTEPFYLRDQTFSRVFTTVASGSTGSIKITAGNQGGTVSIDSNATGAVATAADINGTNGILAGADGNNTVVIIATDPAAADFTVYRTSGGDNLAVSAATPVLAQGSVADIYSLSHLAKNVGLDDFNLTANIESNSTGLVTDDNVTITVTTLYGTSISMNYTLVSDTNVSYGNTLYPLLETHINEALEDNNLTSTIDFTVTNASDYNATLALVGSDVIDISISQADANLSIPAGTTLLAGKVNVSAGDLAADLKYNSVYSPNYVMDGPLYTMREAGFDLKALVTGTMPMDGVSTMQWDSIDLTRVPSEWFTSQDYNLFDTDEQAGYWAYLELNGAANPLSVGNISLTPLDYVHYYDGETTTNAFSTNIKVAVNGIDETRDEDTLNGGSKSARVTASFGGKKTELTRESQNLYSGKINFYEVEGAGSNSAFTLVIDVADGLGNKISTTTSVIDNQKPTAPTASFDGSSITISSPSTDVAAYYVFDNIIPEVYSAGNELLHLENEPDGEVIGSGICGATVTVASAVGSLKVVAVDGEGEIYKGNVSNSTSVAYMAIAKNRIVLSDINNNNEIVASVGGTPYSTACAAGTPVTTNDYAMQLTSMTNTKTAKIAFPVMASGVDLTGTPITEYVRNDANDAVAKITYAPAYAGEEVFVMLNGVVFGHTLSERAVAELTTPTAGTNLNAGIKTGVEF